MSSTLKVGDLMQVTARVTRDDQPHDAPVIATVTTRAGTRTFAPGAGLRRQIDGSYLLEYRCDEPGPLLVKLEGGGASHEIKRVVLPAELAAVTRLASLTPASVPETVEPSRDRSQRDDDVAYLRERGVEVDDSKSDAWVRGAARAMRGQSRDDYSRRQRDAWKPR